jgi:hypothetical protein
MALVRPLKINALILRADPRHSRVWILHCLSDQLGRVSFSAIPRKETQLSPFCLIEATISPQSNGFASARDLELLDTFSELRSHPESSKGALFLRAIIEKCLPLHAPSGDVWQLLLSLLDLLPSFHDWKAAPLMLALTFFEHEGVSPQSITELPLLTCEGREAARYLLEADEAAWRRAHIPEDLFTAVMETIGIQEEYAKGGT